MKLGRVILASLAVTVVAAVLGAGACGVGVGQEGGFCLNPDPGHYGPDGVQDYCHCEDPPGSEGRLGAGDFTFGLACCSCASPSGLCFGGSDKCFCPFDEDAGKFVCADGGPGTCPYDDDAGAYHCSETADGGSDAEGPIGSCKGTCVPDAPLFWEAPSLLWFGAELQAPPCPDSAPAFGFEGHADLNAPALPCGECSCGSPSGSCSLPTMLTANAAPCPGTTPGTLHTSFDPASGWTGSCDTNASIPSGKLCSGGKCVQSVTFGPLGLTESGSCEPVTQPIPQDFTTTWSTFARACVWTPQGACSSAGEVCLSTALPDGFRACIAHEGDVACPSGGPYQERHVFYEGLDDTRSCAACACSAPMGSSCSATISIYLDGACSSPLDADLITSSGPLCKDVPAGSPLGSKSAGPATYTAGACAPSGGEAMGAAEPSLPVTFCCLAG